MKIRPILLIALSAILLSCASAQDAEKPATDVPVRFPFAEFASAETTAKAGEYVLVPSYVWIEDALKQGLEETTFIWYAQKMRTPGKDFSEIDFLGDLNMVPNAYIIAIPKGGEAKVGDIVITWWQSGSGMQRAIVVDDKNPAQPVVRYLDIAYDNPAKNSEGVPIGQMDEKLKPNSFFVAKEMDPGTGVVAEADGETRFGILIRANDTHAVVLGWGDKLAIYPREAVRPTPLKPSVKVGDKVRAPYIGKPRAATVTKVDARNGRVFIKFDGRDREEAVGFGDVLN